VGRHYWHALRGWELHTGARIKGQSPAEDAWPRGGFTQKSGYDPDGKCLRATGIGLGYSDADVDELAVIPLEVLKEYQDMLLAETMAYLDAADNDEIRRSIPTLNPPGQMTNVATRLQHLVTHTWNHIGELSYARGMLGMPDATYPGK